MRPIRLVCHTHWDREWYLSFEQFREKLVATLDGVLDMLAADDRWTHFHLDGQTVMIDDYLSVRPDREREISKLVAAGRLSCGPWTSLVDEFLVSGESLIRNLEDGAERAAQLGGRTAIAYLPDQFGHVGQMPQLLQQAGLTKAVVWRGVPSEVTGSGFEWAAPDGSCVEALYLPWGYAQGARIESESDGFVERMGAEVRRSDPFLREGETLLLMTGDDHVRPDAALPDLIEAARARGIDVGLTSLSAFMESYRPPSTRVRGELRSAARANLLPNTYSVRPYQKVARAEAEHLLERYAQPLAALVDSEPWPERELSSAWLELHLNGAHDSVCGCSTDEVADAVDARTERASGLAGEIAQRSLSHLAGQMSERGTLLFNPSLFERNGVPGLGWAVVDAPPARLRAVPLTVEGDRFFVEVDSTALRLGLRDQRDDGDLYTFEPAGPVEGPRRLSVRDGVVEAEFERCRVLVTAERAAGDPSVALRLEVDNWGPDHRLQLFVDAPGEITRAQAGAPFEIVDRPALGEGGVSEGVVRQWPARGFVTAGRVTILNRGVFEYEIIDAGPAVTLLRCVGTISRAELTSRKTIAGPDVATPAAQLQGVHELRFGVMPAGDAINAWERHALPLLATDSSGTGSLPRKGRLVELDAPALSTITRRGGRRIARIWNPSREASSVTLAGRTRSLGPGRIETIELD